MMLTVIIQQINIHQATRWRSCPRGRKFMATNLTISRRKFLTASTRVAGLTAAIGIAPQFIRPGRAFAADKLADGMIGGPTGFEGSERYQYGADTPEGRAVEAAKAMKA